MSLSGFGNYHQSESISGTLPTNQNSPQKCELGLYAEQLSGTAFTRPRHQNLHSWLYRSLPSVSVKNYEPYPTITEQIYPKFQPPNPMRWQPREMPSKPCNFIEGIIPVAGNTLCHTYLYLCNTSMERTYIHNRDGELLFVPYEGKIRLATEFGNLEIHPGMIAVIPRGVVFKVILLEKEAKGYLCENQKTPLKLPELGPLGANGLANPRHFIYPTASFESFEEETILICKYQQQWWVSKNRHSPLNVVAWQGNYAPYSYDLSLFNTMGSVSFDHPDPSIFTVLTSESSVPGVANLDFVIFPSRWMVSEHTFRPPYFHRNIMSEFMGLIQGEYDAKKEGFLPGGISVHNCMSGHGPDAETYLIASEKSLRPEKYDNTLAFMFESRKSWLLSDSMLNDITRELDYSACWHGLPAGHP